MSEAMPLEEAVMLEERMRLAIRTYDFKPQESLVLHLLVDRTYRRRVREALIPSLDYVVRLTRILRADAGAVLRRLEDEYHVIGSERAPEFRARDRQDPRWYWCLPKPAEWTKVGPRVDREWAAQLHRELDFIETSQPRLLTPDGKEFGPAEKQGLKAEIAAASHDDALQDERQASRKSIRPGPARERAADGHDVCGNSAHVGVGKFRTHTENPITWSPRCEEIPHTSAAFTDAQAPARAQHVHEHGTPSVPQSMVHEHARGLAAGGEEALRALSNDALFERLDEEGRYALDVLEEIVGQGAEKFRRTWLLRLCDRWRHQAMMAIGEIKRRQIAGERPRIGWGETANDLFHRAKRGPDQPKQSAKAE
jgi:hypothetical protein